MEFLVSLEVSHHIATKGSYRVYVSQGADGRPRKRFVNDNPELQRYTDHIRAEARKQLPHGWEPSPLPVMIDARFTFTRPKGHHGTGSNRGSLRPSAPPHHIVKPDVDKVLRAVLDALTDVVYLDDKQVIDVWARKRWIDAPGVDDITKLKVGVIE